MSAILGFMKTHLISLLSGFFSLGFIAVGVLGMMSDTVEQQMQQEINKAGEISRYKSKPRNEAAIEAERERGERFQEEYTSTLAVAHAINERQPLLNGVFPTPASDAKPFEFREEYQRVIRQIPRMLQAGDLPTEAEIQDEADNVRELLERLKEQQEEGGESAEDIRDRLPRGTTPPPGTTPGTRPRAAGSKKDDPKYDPAFRARVNKARRIRTYANLSETNSSFHIAPLYAGTSSPEPEQMWYAQVAWWIEQDVIRAIADLNAAAAAALAEGREANVATMPVKHVLLIRVNGYAVGGEVGNLAFPELRGGGGGTAAAGPVVNTTPLFVESFTNRTSDEEFDVVRFSVVVIVDQRDLLDLIDRIAKQNFYQLLATNITAVDRAAAEEQGYYYGPEPIVRARLEFEGYMARKVFQPMMPRAVLKALGIVSEDEER